jgi:hypothetical protein
MTPPATAVATSSRASTTPMYDTLRAALRGDGGAAAALETVPTDTGRRDRFLSLLAVYDLHAAPLDSLGTEVRFQGHPSIAALKHCLETDWLAELELAWLEAGHLSEAVDTDRVVRAMRAVAARDRLPVAYRWLAQEATWDDVVHFLALEGGPDGGFDDLVAVCQVGLSGSAKLELAKNYWDEMGNGDPTAVHTTLHERLVEAVDLPRIPREQQPVEALERAALSGLLATNRWLQPEMLGALGLLELQAGPRCRLVLQAFDRLGAPADAYPFYVEHADVDPVHGRDWMDKAVVPTVTQRPDWGPRIVKGAWWRSVVNLAFFDAVHQDLVREQAA